MMLDDKKALPLQAADMFAWTVRRYRDKQVTDPRWDWLVQRMAKLVGWGMGYDLESFRILLEEKENFGH
jgi:hypothetical protein